MPFSNLDYLYQNLPARFRREDRDAFLKRYLQFFGESLDDYDAAYDSFFASIDSATANEEWIEFWLENLFGWSWFPVWFTVAEKRRLYSNFGRHLARRGTRRGIELFLLDFGIVARVHTRTQPYGEFVWGETHFAVTEPLNIIVEILFIKSTNADLSVWGEGAFGDFHYADPKPLYTEKEITKLLRFVQPHAQEIIILWRVINNELTADSDGSNNNSTDLPLYGDGLFGE